MEREVYLKEYRSEYALEFYIFLTGTLALFQQILHTAKTAALLGRLLLDLRGL